MEDIHGAIFLRFTWEGAHGDAPSDEICADAEAGTANLSDTSARALCATQQCWIAISAARFADLWVFCLVSDGLCIHPQLSEKCLLWCADLCGVAKLSVCLA